MLKWGMAAALAVLAAPAAAADWRITALNGEKGDHTLFLVDASTVERRQANVSFTLQMLYESPFQEVNRTVSQVEATCGGRTFTISSASFYSDERVIGTHRPTERVEAPPGSAFDSAIAAACTRQWGSRTIEQPRATADAIFGAEDPVEAAERM